MYHKIIAMFDETHDKTCYIVDMRVLMPASVECDFHFKEFLEVIP